MRKKYYLDKGFKFHFGDVELLTQTQHSNIYSFTKTGGISGPPKSDFDTSGWETVDLPHDFCVKQDFDPENSFANCGYRKRGIGWYQKKFTLDLQNENKQILFDFDGIMGESTIYFNGSVVKRNFSGYNSFYVDVTDRAYFGEKVNTLAIRVDAKKPEGWWYEGAGLYRHAYLTIKEKVHIDKWGVWVNPQKIDDEWITKIETTLENVSYKSQEVTLKSIIIDKNGNKISNISTNIVCDKKTVVNQEISIENPNIWSLENTNLYKIISELYIGNELIDHETTAYGYRTIRFCADTGFYLNEKPMKLKGTCNHQDHGGIGVAVHNSINKWRIEQLLEMGSNAYRCAHNNPTPEILDYCDELGMLVMDENRNFETRDEAIEQVTSMVKRDRNHPCVIIYSIFNEEPLQGSKEGQNIAKRLISTIKELDDTRPIVGAMNGGVLEDDGCSPVLDVIGINYQLDIFDETHKKFPNTPIVSSETASAYSNRGIYKSCPKKQVFNSYDEEKASWGDTVRKSWKVVNESPFIMGIFSWTGFDYLGEPSPYVWPAVSTFFGIMDTCGFKKDVYYLYQAFWNNKPILHILPHWNFSDGETIKVMTHTNCDEVELFLNEKSLGKKSVSIYEQTQWSVPFENGVLSAKGYNKGILTATFSVETTGSAYAVEIEPMRCYIYDDTLDAILVNFFVVDKMGRFVPTADNKIKLEGNCKILAVANGDPNSNEPFYATERSLYNGRCQATIKSIPGQKSLTLKASSEGLQEKTIIIEVRENKEVEYIENINIALVTGWLMSDIFEEKPDPNIVIDESDMNTLEPVAFENGAQMKFTDKQGKYALYRGKFETNAQYPSQKLHFSKIAGEVWVYINDKLVHHQCYMGDNQNECLKNNCESMNIDISNIEKGNNEITVITKSLDSLAGIIGIVTIIMDE